MGLENHPGSFGVTGVKDHFHKKDSTPTDNVALIVHMHLLDPLYKSYGSRKLPGVIWGHRGQRSFSLK